MLDPETQIKKLKAFHMYESQVAATEKGTLKVVSRSDRLGFEVFFTSTQQ